MSAWNDFNDAEQQQSFDLIPKGTVAPVRMTIKPGGHDDASQGWTGGYATQSFETGSIFLACEFVILDGEYLELNLKGEYMTGVRVLVSPEFFDLLTAHPNVVKAYQWYQESLALRADQRTGFTFAGVTFEEYLGQASDVDGNVRKFIASGEGHAFPEGTLDTFATYFAPADFNETVNTLGQPLYAKQEPREFGRGTDLHTQSNPLPMCHRPGLLVKLLAS
jgi:hypothetical protein